MSHFFWDTVYNVCPDVHASIYDNSQDSRNSHLACWKLTRQHRQRDKAQGLAEGHQQLSRRPSAADRPRWFGRVEIHANLTSVAISAAYIGHIYLTNSEQSNDNSLVVQMARTGTISNNIIQHFTCNICHIFLKWNKHY